MNCELCRHDSAGRRLCAVCADTIQRLLQIDTGPKRTEVTDPPGKTRGTAAGAGH